MNNPFLQEQPSSQGGPFLAEVVSVAGGGLVLKIAGEDAARVKEYKCLASYYPKAGHRVLVVPISGTCLVLGQVVDVPPTGVDATTLNGKAESGLSVSHASTGTAVLNTGSGIGRIFLRISGSALQFATNSSGPWTAT